MNTTAPATNAEPPIKYAILEYVTRSSILNVYESLSVDRLLFELVKYDPDRQRSLDRAIAYVPVPKTKLLCHLVLSGQAARDGWVLESRVFKAEYDSAGGRFADNPYRLTIAMGKGKKTQQGGISPDGEPHTRVSMRFSVNDLMSHCLEIRDYLANHQSEIEGVRFLEQLQHYGARLAKQQPPARAVPPRLAGAYRL